MCAGLKQKMTPKEGGGHGDQNRDVVPFPLRLHGWEHELGQNGAPDHRPQIREHGEREMDEGDPPRATMGAHGELCLGRERAGAGWGR